MPVASSVLSVDPHTQSDGRVYVLETHALTTGGAIEHRYLAAAEADHSAAMEARVPYLNNALKRDEQRRTIYSDPGPISLQHQTNAEFADAFWGAVDATWSGDKLVYARLLWWLYEEVLHGWLTSDAVRASYNLHFGKSLNTTQWNALVSSRIAPAHDRYAAMLVEESV
jgi:hypothetical protein